MINKKIRKLFCYALSSLLLVGCDDGGTAADGTQEIDRRVNISAATLRSGTHDGDEVMTNGIFKVLAWKRDSVGVPTPEMDEDGNITGTVNIMSYTDELWVGLQASSGEYIPEMVWFPGEDTSLKPWTTLNTYYWPDKYIACDFYAVYPSTASDIEVLPRDGSKRPVRYIDFNNSTGKMDLLLAATTSNKAQAVADAIAASGTDGLVKLLFHHALSRVTLKAQRDTQTPGPQLNVTVKSVELCNVLQSGTFRFQDLPNTPGTAPTLGIWELRGQPYNITLYSDATGIALTDADTPYALTDASTSLQFIPQCLMAWDYTTKTIADNNLLPTPGTYLKIGCSITIDGYEGDFADDGYVYVPFSAVWTMDNHYEYTLHFGGGYDHEGHLILQPVTVTSTVTPWETGNTQAIDPAWI
ncbi:MAG: fimbrillin family protein [Prevotella sp.]|nr:fimbrillin family protein [Prevotella sp.]